MSESASLRPATNSDPVAAPAGRGRGPDLMLLALLAYVASLPFMTLRIWPGLGHLLFLSELVFVVCALVAVPVALSRRWWRRLGGLEAWAGLYLLAALAATVLSQEPAVSARKLVGVAYLVAVGVITHLALDEPWKRRRLVSVWLAVSAITAGASILGVLGFYLGLDQWTQNPLLRHYGSLTPGAYPRVGAFFLNVNMLCNYLIVGLALAWERWMGEGRRSWPYGMLVGGLCVAALFTFSTGLGGIVLVCGLLAARRWPGSAGPTPLQRRLTVGAALAAAAIFLLAATAAPSVDGGLELSPRALTWQGAWETFARHPLVGKGLGLPAADVDFQVASGRVIHFTDGHNVWLNLGAQAGLIGLVALAGLVIWSLRRGLAAGSARADGGPSPAVLTIALVGAFLYHGLTGSFEDARHLWLLLGLLAASTERRSLPGAGP